MDSLVAFKQHVAKEAESFKELTKNSGVLLLHHNDSDGLSSGATLYAAFERAGIQTRGYSLEKPYPKVLGHIFDDPMLPEDTVVVFADFGSGMLPLISQLNSGKRQIYILDHHTIKPAQDDSIHLVNSRSFDICGNSDCSASAVCYLFAKELSEFNGDLSRFGVLGAAGDRHFDKEGKYTGINALIAEQAEEEKLLSYDGSYILHSGIDHNLLDLTKHVDALGSFGYLDNGVDFALKGLQEGFDERYIDKANQYREQYEDALKAFLDTLELQATEYVDWFILPKSFDGMGVKTVGLVCEEIVSAGLVKSDRYLAGFQEIPPAIPGLGRFDFKEYKISMRVSPALRERMKGGEMPGLGEALPRAAETQEGFVDACHMHAAAATVDIGKEMALVAALNAEIKAFLAGTV